MPLLRRKPFVRKKVPEGLSLDEEVFFCKLTKEVFLDYNEFFERTILCNSLVWTCGVTGRSGLTFGEAIQSEQRALKCLEEFPSYFHVPLLVLAQYSKRSRFSEFCDDVFRYARDRFCVGEEVDVLYEGHRCSGIILNSHIPNELPSVEDPNVLPVPFPEDYEYTVKVLRKDEPIFRCEAMCVSRKKNSFTRAKNRLFLKQYSECRRDVWKVKDVFFKKFNLDKIKFHDFWAGTLPTFALTAAQKALRDKYCSEKANKRSSEKKTRAAIIKQQKKEASEKKIKAKELLRQKRQKKKEEKKKKQTEDKELSILLKASKRKLTVDEIEKLRANSPSNKEKNDKSVADEKLAKKRKVDSLKYWINPRDDLELEDHKALPDPVPVHTRISDSMFGDVVLILEFFLAFGDLFDIEEYLPGQLSFKFVEECLLDGTVNSPLYEVLRFLLITIFETQDEEEGDEFLKCNLQTDEALDLENVCKTYHSRIFEATNVATWSVRHLKTSIKDLILNKYTVSEVLRLHLESSGFRPPLDSARFRYQQRGGFLPNDDPGFFFKLENSAILEKLKISTIFELGPAEKLDLLIVLCYQLLTYTITRDCIDENFESCRQLRRELRELQQAEARRDKEIAIMKQRRKQEREANGQKPINAVVNEKSSKFAMKRKLINEVMSGQMCSYVDVSAVLDSDDESLNSDEKKILREKMDIIEKNRKVQFHEKEMNLNHQILRAVAGAALHPVGKDRLHRSYWAFKSIKGLYVEEDKFFRTWYSKFAKSGDYVPPCLTNNPDWNAEMSNKIPKWPALSDVPSSACRPHWGVYYTEKHFDDLINAMNSRGFRESALHSYLVAEKTNLICDIPDFCRSNKPSVATSTASIQMVYKLKEFIVCLEQDLVEYNLTTLSANQHSLQTYLSSCTLNGTNSPTKLNQMQKLFKQVISLILEIVDVKHLLFPFTISEDDAKMKTESTGSDDDTDKVDLRREWLQSLQKCTSISQLFLHVLTLDRSIWRPTQALSSRCYICRRKDHYDAFVCKQCHRKYHSTCLCPTPPRNSSQWLCFDCKKTCKRNERRRRKPAPSTVKPHKSQSVCPTEQVDVFLVAPLRNDGVICEACGKGGFVICCDLCPRMFHLKCAIPELDEVPRVDWFCQVCTGEIEASQYMKNTLIRQLGETSGSFSSPYLDSDKLSKSNFPAHAPKASKRSTPTQSKKQTVSVAPKRRSLTEYSKNSNQLSNIQNNSFGTRGSGNEIVVCEQILLDLAKHSDAWPFLQPVDKREVVDYYEHIKHPVDIATMKGNFKRLKYTTSRDFINDVELMFNNCYDYNHPEDTVTQCGRRLEAYFLARLKDFGIQI